METNFDLNEFINQAKLVVKEFEEKLGWKKDVDNEQLVPCPINGNHYVSQESLEKHTKKCKWRKNGYTHEEVIAILEDEASHHTRSTISIDDIVSKIAPGTVPLRTHELYVSTLTREERLRIFDEVRAQLNQNKQKQQDPFLYQDLDETSKQTSSDANEKSSVEVMKKVRDHKRRRQSYRAKNVHVTKRSRTEVLRDILAIHMEELKQKWNPKSRSPSPATFSLNSPHEYRRHRGRNSNRKHFERSCEQKQHERDRDHINRVTHHSFINDKSYDSRDCNYYSKNRGDRRHEIRKEKRSKYTPSPERSAFVFSAKSVPVAASQTHPTASSTEFYTEKDNVKTDRSLGAKSHKHSYHEKKHKKYSRKREKSDRENEHKIKKHKRKSPD